MAALAQPVEVLLLLAAVANLLDLQNDIASLNTLAQCREECIGVDIAPPNADLELRRVDCSKSVSVASSGDCIEDTSELIVCHECASYI